VGSLSSLFHWSEGRATEASLRGPAIRRESPEEGSRGAERKGGSGGPSTGIVRDREG
jgi:hypothetical protein